MEREVLSNTEDLKKGVQVSSSRYIHGLIHEIHEASDFLLDDDQYNDNEALQKLEVQLQELFRAFALRMNCR